MPMTLASAAVGCLTNTLPSRPPAAGEAQLCATQITLSSVGSGSEDSRRMVGKPYLTGLWKGSPSTGQDKRLLNYRFAGASDNHLFSILGHEHSRHRRNGSSPEPPH
jgi:hypothetical protein